MSFTAEVKDELSRVEGDLACDMVELSAIMRVCGSLSFSGKRFRVSLATETGAVARTLIKLLHNVYNLTTELTIRRSVLHKTRNYLIVVPEQPRLNPALVQMGILNEDLTIAQDIDTTLVARKEWARAYLRGSFMGGGFVADPHGDAHFELVSQTQQFANALVVIMKRFGIRARVSQRRGSYVIYLKNAQEITAFLVVAGAKKSVCAFEDARMVKSLRNSTNRLVNAELANQRKATTAASDQQELIDELDSKIGIEHLPPALRDFCELRRDHPELSLRELGEASIPPLSKSAVYHRVRRLQELLTDYNANLKINEEQKGHS
ncbi:MAG: DNA-binding protein WhiA [Coriobacteriales bacterium]|nr:DNA-binding protein WhiA [Coriobacteriales bacterium]